MLCVFLFLVTLLLLLSRKRHKISPIWSTFYSASEHIVFQILCALFLYVLHQFIKVSLIYKCIDDFENVQHHAKYRTKVIKYYKVSCPLRNVCSRTPSECAADYDEM